VYMGNNALIISAGESEVLERRIYENEKKK
jgi:hypothetical protein